MILYFGNILSGHGYSRTTIEYLGPRLKLYNDVMMLSSHKNILFRYLTMCFVLVLNIRKTKLILIDTYSSNAFYYALSIGLLSKLFQIPFIPILHGSGLPKRYQTSTAPINSLLKNSAINVTPSLFLKKQFRKHKVLTCYIPNTIDIENYRFKPRKFITPKLLWVRSFHKIYNPKMAIKVLHGVLKENQNTHLTMVGPNKDGSQQSCMDLAERMGIAKQVTFAGLLPKKEWISLSEKSDIFINTTHMDNMPVSIIEAMALGFPIVSTDVGGIPFLLKDDQNALLVRDNDIDGMVEKINLLFRDTHLSNKLSENARITAEQYSWKAVYPKWEKVINIYSKP